MRPPKRPLILLLAPLLLFAPAACKAQIVLHGNIVVQGNVSLGASTVPQVFNLSPALGPVGATVIIMGVNFGSMQGASQVSFNGAVATVQGGGWSATSIVVTVPSGAVSGGVVVTVGNVASNATLFTVTGAPPAPTITSVATGILPFGSYGGGAFDTVNNANLNVHFQIPVLAKPGPFPFSYAIVYDSSVWSPGSAWSPLANWGWASVTQATAPFGYINYRANGPNYCYLSQYPYTRYTFYVFNSWAYYDQLGTSHPFNISVATQTPCTPPPVGQGQETAISEDSAGYTLTAYAGSTSATAILYSRSGGLINVPAVTSGVGSCASTCSIADSNGNTLSATASGGTLSYYDTLLGMGAPALTVSGAAPNPTSFKYPNTNASGGNSSVTMQYAPYTVQTNFGCTNPTVAEYGPTAWSLVSEIDLPDNSSSLSDKYTFTYEVTPGDAHNPHYVTGRIASVTLPTGGTITYTYTGSNNGITCADGSGATIARKLNDNNGNQSTWQYVHTENGTAWSTAVTDPQSNQTAYTFLGFYETERSNSLATVYTCYNAVPAPCNPTPTTAALSGIYQVTVTTAIGGLQSLVNTSYNTYGLPTETDEYPYGTGTWGALLRKTLVTYNPAAGCGVTNANVVDRVCSVQVENGTGALAAQTTNTYDGNGNLLSVNEYTTGSAYLTRSFAYNTSGSVTNGTLATSTDWTNSQASLTTYTYSGSVGCNNGLVTKIQPPLIAATIEAWDCNGGVVTNVTDPNTQPTNFSYDIMWRPTATSYPDGGSTTVAYTSPTQADMTTKLTSGSNRHDRATLDGLGRAVTQQTLDPSSNVLLSAGTTYDLLGRVLSSSDPAGGTGGATDTYAYDALGRASSVTHADGNAAKIYYGATGGLASAACPAGTSGAGYPSLAVDETGRMREMWTDALGNLLEVDEPNASSGALTTGEATCYAYDLLGDLTSISQAFQMPTPETRSYTYDMLGRLTSAITPESGTTHYCYTTTSPCVTPDPGTTLCSGDLSAVCTRTDALVTRTYAYDALNRLIQKSYSDGVTPTATYNYDQTTAFGVSLSNPVGRLTSTVVGTTTGDTIYSYDVMGRVLYYWQCSPYNCASTKWELTYGYDLAGDVTSIQYPSSDTVTYGVTSAQQPASAVDAGNSINYAAGSCGASSSWACYFPSGALQSVLNGKTGIFAGITASYTYNNRLQPSTMAAASSNGTALYLGYSFVNSNGTNNGNVMSVTNNITTTRSQTFTYDALNRLASGQTSATSGQACWGFNYGYDVWGNLLSATASKCVTSSTWTVNANNQPTNSGYGYDAAGNLTSDPNYSYTYDGEGRLTKVKQSGTTIGSYFYNALGQRDQKTGTNNINYVYGVGGEVLAEYNSTGGLLNEYVYFGGKRIARRDGSSNVYYYYADALGSTRAITNSSGTVCYDSDYYPFGIENNFTSNGCQNYSPQNYKFTGQERDGETDNDYYWARYFGVLISRWMTPDPLAGDITNPQSLNRYAYVLNNPTTLVDPLGLDAADPDPLTICNDGQDAAGYPCTTVDSGGGGGGFTIFLPVWPAGSSGGGGGGGGGGSTGGGGFERNPGTGAPAPIFGPILFPPDIPLWVFRVISRLKPRAGVAAAAAGGTIVCVALEPCGIDELLIFAGAAAFAIANRQPDLSSCKPCSPPVGTLGYRLDTVPPHDPHYPYPGTHWHLYVMSQNPLNCQCFWHWVRDGDGPPPPGAVPITPAAGGGAL